MKLAIIHYHLNRGGVTQAIVNHLRALDGELSGARLPVALLYGGRCDGWPKELPKKLHRLAISLYQVDELDYDNVRPRQRDLAAQLRATLQHAGFDARETVLHAHNHALGKNVALPDALASLARDGYAALLQVHDFAEDFRPENYRRLAAALNAEKTGGLPARLYPQASQIHYAVLNDRDLSILSAAGVDDSRLHLFPNAVAELGPLPPRDEARAKLADCFAIPTAGRFVLYPVRGIRRKNLGEALLWSALAERETYFGLTLPPANPVERRSYMHWKDLAKELALPWGFEMGSKAGLRYVDNIAAADLLLTTSVAEGFGLVFLESWLAGRTLVGRDLPDITVDFVAKGLRFPGLQPNLLIPIDWLGGEKAFRTNFAEAYFNVVRSYGQQGARSPYGDIDKLIRDGLVDFGQCGTQMQRHVVERVASDRAARQQLLAVNPWIACALDMRCADPQLVERNAEIIRTEYSLARCGRRLLAIYERLAASDREDVLKALPCANRILERFLEPSRFQPLRIEP